MKRLWLAAIVPLVFAGTASAQNRELIQLQADVVALSSQVSQIQTTLDERNAVFLRLIEQVVDEVVGLSSTLDRVTGTSDNVRMSNETLSGEMRAMMSSLQHDLELMDRNIQELGLRLDTLSNQVTAVNTSSSGINAPSNLFSQAEADFFAGNYPLAQRGFEDFITLNPSSPRAVDAQLYLGNASYNTGDFELAILQYDILIQRYPDSDRRAAALYQKGLAQANLNQPQSATASFERVVSEFPGTREASLAQDRLLETEVSP